MLVLLLSRVSKFVRSPLSGLIRGAFGPKPCQIALGEVAWFFALFTSRWAALSISVAGVVRSFPVSMFVKRVKQVDSWFELLPDFVGEVVVEAFSKLILCVFMFRKVSRC